jgi:hypothetical protein
VSRRRVQVLGGGSRLRFRLCAVHGKVSSDEVRAVCVFLPSPESMHWDRVHQWLLHPHKRDPGF